VAAGSAIYLSRPGSRLRPRLSPPSSSHGHPRSAADSLIVGTDPILLDRRQQIVAFASIRRWPAVYFVNPNNPNSDSEKNDARAGAQKLWLETIVVQARNETEINAAFQELVGQSVGQHHAACDCGWISTVSTTYPFKCTRQMFTHRHRGWGGVDGPGLTRIQRRLCTSNGGRWNRR
jgi:hypothetical protein